MDATVAEVLSLRVKQANRSRSTVENAREEHMQDTERTKEKLKELLGDEHERLASPDETVFAFYVVGDPLLPECLRCIDAPGAMFPAAASHFLPKDALLDLGSPKFYADARIDPLRDGNSQIVERLIANDPERNRIFGDFVTRERIASRARFIFAPNNWVEAILTINFRRALEATEWNKIQDEYQRVFEKLIAAYPCLPETYKEKQHDYFPRLLALRKSVNAFLLSELEGMNRNYGDYLNRILDTVVSGFTTNKPADCFGSIWFLSTNQHVLELGARSAGTKVTETSDFDIARGEGVISWVALRKRAILISNLEHPVNKAFQRIHVSDSLAIRSQLAAPIMVDGRLLGVINLESTSVDLFDADSSGYLSAIADDIAALHRLVRALRSRQDRLIRQERPESNGPRVEERRAADSAIDAFVELDIASVSVLKEFDNAKEGKKMEAESEKSLAVRKRLSTLLLSDSYHYIPGEKFWHALEKLLGGEEWKEWKRKFEARELSHSPGNYLQNTLDNVVADWVKSGDCSGTIERLDSFRERLWERMESENPQHSEREELPVIADSLRAAVQACASLGEVKHRCSTGSGRGRDNNPRGK